MESGIRLQGRVAVIMTVYTGIAVDDGVAWTVRHGGCLECCVLSCEV